MKFEVKVCGKDSVSEAVSKTTVKTLKGRGVKTSGRKASVEETDAWDRAFEKEYKALQDFVYQFVRDGRGGDDAVVLEFDTDAGTCSVVPRVRKVKPYKHAKPAAPTHKALFVLRDVADKYFGTVLTDEQARDLFAGSADLREAMGKNGSYDTADREVVGDVLAERILGPTRTTDDNCLGFTGHDDGTWHWPLNASSGSYTKAFYTAYRAAALKAGYRVTAAFDKHLALLRKKA